MDWAVLHAAGYFVDVEMREIKVIQKLPLREHTNVRTVRTIHYQSFKLPDSIHNRAKQAFDIATNHFVRSRLET